MSTLPRGFRCSVTGAAIKRPGRTDMALVLSEAEATVAGMFTTNKIKAAPLRLCIERVKSGRARALVVNSGNANACTGPRGMRDARETARLVAGHTGVPEGRVFVCSTGVIGVPMPMERMRPAVEMLALGLTPEFKDAGLEDFARAIMTTDTFPKFVSKKLTVGRREAVISAAAKGAGMIAPDMATMLCFIFTDLAVERAALRAALKDATEGSFNAITIDGDRSTNDTVLALANGMAGNALIRKNSPGFGKFRTALADVTQALARMIVQDGEGATKVVEIEIAGARTGAEAKRGAAAIANSLLVKTALHGADPNWGRVMAVLGATGIAIREEKTDIYFGRVKVAGRGMASGRTGDAAGELKGKEVKIRVALNIGKGKARVLTCDLSEEYVKINAEYTT